LDDCPTRVTFYSKNNKQIPGINARKGGFMAKRQLTRKQRRNQETQIENVFNKKFSMKRIQPITARQEELFQSYEDGCNIANIGSAGTGKTYVSLYLALEDVLEKDEYRKVIIIRSTVQSREQGHMPGDAKEKLSHFETPYVDIANDLFGRGDAYQILKQKNMIEFMSTSFVRGLTWDNCIIVVDEIQNMTYEELRTIITRTGENSKIVFCGDTRQDDLRNSKNRFDKSGIGNFLRVIEQINSFSVVNFTKEDIVRSGIVKDFIVTEERILDYA